MKVRILALATAAVLLTGCSVTDKAGAAAVVGETQIPATVVTEQVNLVRTQIENTPVQLLQDLPGLAMISQMIVDRLVLEEVLAVAVAELDIQISDAQVDEYRDTVFRNYGEAEVTAQLVSRNGLAAEYIDDFMYDIMVQREIMDILTPGQPEEIQAAALYKYLSGIAKNLGVEVAPRYGVWDPQTMQTSASENYLSTTTVVEEVQ